MALQCIVRKNKIVITGQYGGKLCHEISPWCGMVLVLELELDLDLVSENLC